MLLKRRSEGGIHNRRHGSSRTEVISAKEHLPSAEYYRFKGQNVLKAKWILSIHQNICISA